MPDRIFATAGEPGFVRVTRHPQHAGVRMSIASLIKGLAQRGRQ